MWCVFSIAIGAINLPIRGWRGAGAIHLVTVAGRAHVGKLREKLVDAIEESSIMFAGMIFIAIEKSPTCCTSDETFLRNKKSHKKNRACGENWHCIELSVRQILRDQVPRDRGPERVETK